MLGTDLMALLSAQHQTVGVDLEEMDITRRQDVLKSLSSLSPDVVINAAAYTDVDGSETNEALAFRVNADGPENIALACREQGAHFIHVSTDYVFDGRKQEAYEVDDRPNPVGVYGRSKWEGEQRIEAAAPSFCIVRTAWLYGKAGRNFVKAILHQAAEKNLLKVVSDQKGSPTYTMDLAGALAEIAARRLGGVYHVTNKGACTWLEFAVKILALSGKQAVSVEPISTEELGRPAPRPANSVLNCSAYEADAGQSLRSWEEALKDYLSC